ncbi:MAG: hypothetical protein ACR2JE_06345, partial [Acidobacteriaceae bacterium]
MPPMKCFFAGAAVAGCLTSLTARPAVAQEAAAFVAPAAEPGRSLPDAPEPATSSGAHQAATSSGAPQASTSEPITPIPATHQTKRILGIVPNFRAVST